MLQHEIRLQSYKNFSKSANYFKKNFSKSCFLLFNSCGIVVDTRAKRQGELQVELACAGGVGGAARGVIRTHEG